MSMANEENNAVQKVQLGPMGIVSMPGSTELVDLIDKNLVKRRREFSEKNPAPIYFPGFQKDSYLISTSNYRFATGEGKAVINESVRGHDIFIITDIGNYSCKFKMFGMECPMSPDDHFQDLKRTIAAVGGKARRIDEIL